MTDKHELPHFETRSLTDRRLFLKLRSFHNAVARGALTLEWESALLASIRHILATHVEDCRQAPGFGKESSAVARVREYLETHYAENIALSEVGELTSLSPFHVARAFSNRVGLPPHAYLESIRIRHARALLRSGMAVVDTALSVGYSDQSPLYSSFSSPFRDHPGSVPAESWVPEGLSVGWLMSARLCKTCDASPVKDESAEVVGIMALLP